MQLCNQTSYCRNLSFGLRLYQTNSGAGVYVDSVVGKFHNFTSIKNVNEYKANGIHILELEYQIDIAKVNATNETTNTTNSSNSQGYNSYYYYDHYSRFPNQSSSEQ